jgi:hypothetical protein
MNSVQYTLAAGIVVPAVIAATIILMPSEKDRMAAVTLAEKEAAMQREAEEQHPQRFVLQPFYVPGGALIVEVEAKGMKGLSALCSNLPIVHDAIISQLDADRRLFSQGAGGAYRPDGEKFRRAINAGFSQPHVLGIEVTYQPDTAVMLAGRRKVGSSTRCLTIEKSARHASE